MPTPLLPPPCITMSKPSVKRILTGVLLAASAVLPLAADTVDVKGGARIVGKVIKVDDGAVVVETTYAGNITIKQAEVVAINTDAPVAVRFANGTRIDGKVSGTGDGRVKVANAEGEFASDVAKVAASWAAGGKDPAQIGRAHV